MLRQVVPVVVLLSKFTVAPLQSSAAVGTVKFGVAVQSIVAFPPASPIVGECLSLHDALPILIAEWLPQASVASQVRVKTLRQDVPVVVLLSKFTVAPLQSSAAVGPVKFAVVLHYTTLFRSASPIVGA